MLVHALYIVTLLSSVAGAALIFATLGRLADGGAPEVLSVSIGISLAVIPYVFTRAVQIVVDQATASRRHAELIRTLEIMSDRIDRK